MMVMSEEDKAERARFIAWRKSGRSTEEYNRVHFGRRNTMKLFRIGAAIVAVLLFASIVHADSLRTARVGDPLTKLTQGLDSFTLGPAQFCGQTATVIGYVKHGTDQTMDNASELGAMVNGKVRAIVTFDEADLTQAVTFYMADANGTIQYLADPSNVDSGAICSIL